MGLGIAIAVNGTPNAELAEATSVEVYERMGEPVTYSLRYDLEVGGGDIPYLTDSRFDPGSELSILVPVGSVQYCLVKGPVQGQHVHLEQSGLGSWLEVKGSDTSIKMDRENHAAAFNDVTDQDVVTTILSRYGYTLDVASTPARHDENKHSLMQRETDLHLVRRLARRNGCLFWVSWDAAGTETAHFKRPPVDDAPAAELVINLDQPTISELDIAWDVERPTSAEGKQLDLNAKSDLDLSVSDLSLTALGSSDLAAITGDTRSVHLSAPADDTGDLTARGEGALIGANWFIRATCQTSMAQLGKLVRAHMVVNLRGAGARHSGKYFVAGVRHLIDASAHRMSLELVRNGWGA